MKVFGFLTIGVGLAVALFCSLLFLQQQPAQQEHIVSAINPHGDACVISVTHPHLKLSFMDIEGNGTCSNCLYRFCVINTTGPVGTHGDDVVLNISYGYEYVDSNGNPVPIRRLDGLTNQPIQPVQWKEVGIGEPFDIEGPCPNCIRDDERYITFRLTFFDCSGQQDMGEFYFDLKSQKWLDYIPSLPKTSINSSQMTKSQHYCHSCSSKKQ